MVYNGCGLYSELASVKDVMRLNTRVPVLPKPT